jgi:hypothetical protein
MGLIVTFPHLDFFISYIVTLISLVKSSPLSLPLHRSLSLSTRVCSVTPSCYLVSHSLSRRNTLRRSRSTKATPRVQVGQTSSRNVTPRPSNSLNTSSSTMSSVGIIVFFSFFRPRGTRNLATHSSPRHRRRTAIAIGVAHDSHWRSPRRRDLTSFFCHHIQ